MLLAVATRKPQQRCWLMVFVVGEVFSTPPDRRVIFVWNSVVFFLTFSSGAALFDNLSHIVPGTGIVQLSKLPTNYHATTTPQAKPMTEV
jgi:hypothetical protein